MRIACPYCGSAEVRDAPPGRVKSLHCKNGHAFAIEEGLISFGDAVRIATAIDHPNRLRVLLEFGRKPEMSATEVGERLDLDPATARYHILKLVEHDPPLIDVGRKVPVNGALEQKYELRRGFFEGQQAGDR